MLKMRIPKFFTLTPHKPQILDEFPKNKKEIPFWYLSWALTDSNRRPSACKADALNQLS